jgi:hypothetical protein
MCRIALTLWFTVTTLLGPGVCCCTFAGTSAGGHRTATSDQPVPVSKPAKSCCRDGQQPAPCGEQGKQSPSRDKSCPCEHGKHLKSLPPTEKGDSISAHIKVLIESLADFLVPYSMDLVVTTRTTSAPRPPFSRLSGRDLLAAYSQLRC